VLLALSDPEAQPELPERAVQRIFRLSPAEARMAVALARGLSPAEYAATARVTHETARSRLKVIFRKTGARRQGELVRQLLTSVAALRDA
jgi:DNA-binding CsgD family transcriptional regulator